MTSTHASFDAVYAAPDEDEPRVRLADALRAAGDPRAELIDLQLDAARCGTPSRAARARMRALLAAHRDAWLEPLHGALIKTSVRWERGFPSRGRLAAQRTSARRDALIGLPALATLRALDGLAPPISVLPAEWIERFLFESPLRGLRRLVDLPSSLLPRLLDADPPFAIEQLEVALDGGGGPSGIPAARARHAAISDSFARARGLPRLVDLALTLPHGISTDPGSYEWLWQTEAGRRLEVLRLNAGISAARRLQPVLAAHAGELALRRLVLYGRHDLVLEHAGGAWSRARGRVHPECYPAERVTLARELAELRTVVPDAELDGL